MAGLAVAAMFAGPVLAVSQITNVLTSVTTCPTSTVEHWHGQTEWANSKGSPAVFSTTHTSCY